MHSFCGLCMQRFEQINFFLLFKSIFRYLFFSSSQVLFLFRPSICVDLMIKCNISIFQMLKRFFPCIILRPDSYSYSFPFPSYLSGLAQRLYYMYVWMSFRVAAKRQFFLNICYAFKLSCANRKLFGYKRGFLNSNHIKTADISCRWHVSCAYLLIT